MTLRCVCVCTRGNVCALLQEGDDIECNMTRTGKLSWFIGAKLPDGRSTNQKISIMDPGVIERMKVQPWAYVTLECYGCTGCRTYPKTPVSFSDIKLYGANQSPVVPTWLANPKPQPHQLCTEATHIKGQPPPALPSSRPPAPCARAPARLLLLLAVRCCGWRGDWRQHRSVCLGSRAASID